MFRVLALVPLLAIPQCAPDETVSGYADPSAVFALTELNDESFGGAVTIQFPEEGKVVGNGPCNSFSAEQTAPYPWIAIGPIAATKRACPDLDTEAAFFAALERMTLIEVSGPALILSNDDGESLVFSQTE